MQKSNHRLYIVQLAFFAFLILTIALSSSLTHAAFNSHSTQYINCLDSPAKVI
ncbi:hypothetical protein SAMN05421510_10786 [Nitrosomonas ureae]|uniref:Uncharacterized protein n=1 Tax=Nitrosomonas ureae TaxID=44577 RepID=A0A1H9GVQ0_9PROT|nr:hypothetical protein SAMN05421510_10786 [Nitrosomonas ureae]